MAQGDARKARYLKGKATARAVDAQLVIRKEIEAAAQRIADQLGGIRVGGELGFLDDVVDLIDDVGDVAEEIIVHVTNDYNELTEITERIAEATPALTPVLVFFGVAGPIEQPLTGTSKPNEASAEQLLAARQALLEARDRGRARLKELADSVRAQGEDEAGT
jgi:vacuolar-type H+-ATPase subunit E/Vma4